MSENGKFVENLIKEDQLQQITTDAIEAVLDNETAEGVFREIPILKTIFSTFKVASNIQNGLFCKKLMRFLFELNTVSQDERIKQIIKIEDSAQYTTKVGEKILFIIDKCDDIDKASLTGKFFKCYLENKFDYDTFLFGVACIERTPLPDLLSFIKGDYDKIDTDSGGSEFVSYGLMYISATPPKIRILDESPLDYEDYAPSRAEEMQNRIKVTDFQIKCYVNGIGQELRKYLR